MDRQVRESQKGLPCCLRKVKPVVLGLPRRDISVTRAARRRQGCERHDVRASRARRANCRSIDRRQRSPSRLFLQLFTMSPYASQVTAPLARYTRTTSVGKLLMSAGDNVQLTS